MSKLSELSIRNSIRNSNEIQVRNSNEIQTNQRGSSLPSMLRQNMQLMSGVRKGDNYYIAIHGKSYNEIIKSFKIPISVLEQFYDINSEDDVNAVIAFALESLAMQMGGMRWLHII